MSAPRSSPLFGRAEIYDEIVRHLEETREGAGRALALVGTGGIGKSTLLRAAVECAQDLGYEVRSGRALPADPPLPFALINDVVRAPSKPAAAPPTEEEIESSSVLPLFFAPLEGNRMGEGGFFPTNQEAEGTPEDRLVAHLSNTWERMDSSRTSLFVQISDFFLGLSREKPLLIALDDLQFADDSSLDFLEEFLPLLSEHPIVVLVTTAPTDECPPRTIDAVDRFLSSSTITRLKIRPMTESELGQYVRWILRGKEPGRDAIMRWFTQTDGNPLFTEHLVRASTGLSTSSVAEPRSQDFVEILLGRIRNLGEGERRILAYGAVLGKEFDFPTLALASELDEERLSESLDKLVHGGILREKAGEVYEFVSERVRSDVYAQLTETRRRILHRRAAECLLGRAAERGVNVYELARQFYLGRDDVRALEFNQRAADLAAQAFAFDVAIIHLERAIESIRRIEPRDIALELRLSIEMGRFLEDNGDLKRSQEVLVETVARARSSPALKAELAIALLGLARTRSDLSEFAPARELAGEAYQILTKLGHQKGLLTAHQVLGIASWRLGDVAQAEHHHRAELAIAMRDGTTADQGHAMIDLANTFLQQGTGRLAEALDFYEKAAKLFLDGHDDSARARVLMNRAVLLHNAGQRDQALADIRLALESAERSHSRIWIGYCTLNLAQFLGERGDIVAARAALERTQSMLAPLGDQLAQQQIAMIRGIIDLAAGDLKGAEEAYRAALEKAEQLHLGAELAEMKFRLAGLARSKGERAEAKRLLHEAQEAGVLTLRGDLSEEFDLLARELEAPS
ncbi:MAG: AAA family ATPase [Thermoplasmata archaeon]